MLLNLRLILRQITRQIPGKSLRIMLMHIEVSIPEQSLALFDDTGKLVNRYPVSTAANGVGCVKDSGCTPLGRHIVRAKIGADAPENTVFRGRRPTGEIFTPELKEQFPERDWILTRILWLSGTETGKNRLGNVDTMQRYIYIHGSPDATEWGVPGSHGCIRMRNADLIALFDQVPVGTTVNIQGQLPAEPINGAVTAQAIQHEVND